VTKVLDRAKAELKQSQEALKAPASTFITPQTVVEPTKAQAKIGGKVRFAAVAMVLGFIASLSSAYGVESFSQSRKKKQSRKEAVAAWQQKGSLPEPPATPPTIPPATNGTEVQSSANETVRMHPITPKSS
jgi:nitrate reductase cytochrome c-type subunit